MANADTPQGSMTWMIVEDDGAIRDVIEMMCELWEFKVISFRDGFQAMEYLKSETPASPLPDVALLDIRMPGPWGHEISARIREHPQLKGIGIILMTAYELPGQDEEKYLQTSGADKLLFKPLPPMDELLTFVREVVQARRASA
jgi:CheY-like chemotaxis protein